MKKSIGSVSVTPEQRRRRRDGVLADLERPLAERVAALVPVDPDDVARLGLPVEPVVVVDDRRPPGPSRPRVGVRRPARAASGPRSGVFGRMWPSLAGSSVMASASSPALRRAAGPRSTDGPMASANVDEQLGPAERPRRRVTGWLNVDARPERRTSPSACRTTERRRRRRRRQAGDERRRAAPAGTMARDRGASVGPCQARHAQDPEAVLAGAEQPGPRQGPAGPVGERDDRNVALDDRPRPRRRRRRRRPGRSRRRPRRSRRRTRASSSGRSCWSSRSPSSTPEEVVAARVVGDPAEGPDRGRVGGEARRSSRRPHRLGRERRCRARA